jgi:hypothetical protein
MDSFQLLEMLDQIGTKDKFLELLSQMYEKDKNLMPENERYMMSLAVDNFNHSNTKLTTKTVDSPNDPVVLHHKEFATSIVTSVLKNNIYFNNNILSLLVDCKESTELVNLPREEIRKIFDNTIFKVHNIILGYLPNMIKQGGKIILLNKHRGHYDVISYALQTLLGTLHREIRDTNVSISLLDFNDASNEMVINRVQHCLSTDTPKFQYCIGYDVYTSKLSTKILPEDVISESNRYK